MMTASAFEYSDKSNDTCSLILYDFVQLSSSDVKLKVLAHCNNLGKTVKKARFLVLVSKRSIIVSLFSITAKPQQNVFVSLRGIIICEHSLILLTGTLARLQFHHDSFAEGDKENWF